MSQQNRVADGEQICPECGGRRKFHPYRAGVNGSLDCDYWGEKPSQAQEGPYHCDTFKGGVFGPKGLMIPTDELHGNEVPLLMTGYAQGLLAREKQVGELVEALKFLPLESSMTHENPMNNTVYWTCCHWNAERPHDKDCWYGRLKIALASIESREAAPKVERDYMLEEPVETVDTSGWLKAQNEDMCVCGHPAIKHFYSIPPFACLKDFNVEPEKRCQCAAFAAADAKEKEK